MDYSVLALDQSMQKTGWAHYKAGDDRPTWGLHVLPPWGDSEGRYLWEWFEWLGKLCTEKDITHLFIEDTRFAIDPTSRDHHETLTQMVATIGQIGQAAIVAHLLTRRGHPVEFYSVSPLEWRRLFLGALKRPDGMSKPLWRKELKDAAVAQCNKRGWLIESNDIADALGIMTFGVCTIDPTFQNLQGRLFREAEKNHDDFVRLNK